MVRALEHLPLLGDRADDRLERRALVDVAEAARVDLADDDLEPAADRPEVLETLLPEEPRAVRAAWVVAPPLDQTRHEIATHLPSAFDADTASR